MQIDIRPRDAALTEKLRSHTERRLQFARSGFQGRVLLITGCLADTSGHRGSGVATATFTFVPRDGPMPSLKTPRQISIYVAINRAVGRTGRMLERQPVRNHLSSPFQ